MLEKMRKNFAFIDGQNLNYSIKEDGWKLDYAKFIALLRDKYFITNKLFVLYKSE